MKKSLLLIMTAALFVACQREETFVSSTEESLIVTGNCNTETQTRTAFDTPSSTEIPYKWSAGDYIWLGENKSFAIAEECTLAQFEFRGGTAIIGTGHIFYNMTGQANSAKVLSSQSADGNLGNDGDFGYATLDDYNSFYLEHKTAYVWFDTKSNDANMPKLHSITLATEGVEIAGERIYNFANGDWDNTITSGSSTITLNFEGGKQLQSANEGVMAAMVVLPAEVGGTNLTVTYTFEDESTFTEVKTPSKDFESGATQRISTTIALADLTKPEPAYELRVLTFEDEDVKFDPIEDFAFTYPDYQGGYWYSDYFTLTKWSDYIPRDGQYGNGHRSYEWYDANNTELEFVWPSEESFWGIAGHAGISDYVGTMDDVNSFDDDNMLFMIDLQAYNVKGGANGSKNFCSQYGYLDPDEYATIYSPEGVLPGIQFHDGVARVIDHMYVTNTTYAYGVIIHGECDFGGSFQLTDASTFKIVAYGYDSFDDTEPTITDFYLLNTGQRFVTDWTKWDLSVLGKVVRVEFNLVACDNGYGKYGLVIPAYFAYDDVAVRFEK